MMCGAPLYIGAQLEFCQGPNDKTPAEAGAVVGTAGFEPATLKTHSETHSAKRRVGQSPLTSPQTAQPDHR